MRITSKGQVTIPEAIRNKLNMLPGSEVDFIINEKNGKLYLQLSRKPVSRFAKVKGIASASLSTDEIMQLTRGE